MFPEKLPVYFEMPLNAQEALGKDWAFKFPKFGAYAWSQKEAQDIVRKWQIDFIAEVKSKTKAKDLNDVPFVNVPRTKKIKTELSQEAVLDIINKQK